MHNHPKTLARLRCALWHAPLHFVRLAVWLLIALCGPMAAAADASGDGFVGKAFKDCSDCPTMIGIGAKGGMADYAIGQTEVTQGQWQVVMGHNPSNFADCGSDCPVEQVSWEDAQVFIQKINAKTGKNYRLPTEQEWEFACLAGEKTEYCGGSDVNAVAWWGALGGAGNTTKTTHRVSTKKANAFGLSDMSGNVWEWTDTCHMSGCGQRIVRGGSFFNLASYSRADSRFWLRTTHRNSDFGFRLARMLP